MFNSILVVCVGNICRSPMAEALLRSKAPDGVKVSSAGVGALVGESADPEAIRLMEKEGIDITDHIARQLSPEIAHNSDLILVMEQKHIQHVYAIAPSSRGRVFRLGQWSDRDIEDPYRASPEFFEHIFTQIEEDVEKWSGRLWSV